jgi:RNase P/RNase MRP subunit POP5
MKPLLPTLKERKRYIVYRVITAHPLRRDVSGELLRHLAGTLGAFGMAEAGILSVRYDETAQTGVLRVAHTHVAKAKAALLMAGYLGKTKVCVRTLGVSGILRKAQRFEHTATTA